MVGFSKKRLFGRGTLFYTLAGFAAEKGSANESDVHFTSCYPVHNLERLLSVLRPANHLDLSHP
jgi:hypothetical protein